MEKGEGGPRGAYPVVGSHVHVNATDVDTGGVQVEVDAPESGAEGVGEAGSALVVQRVRLAEDEGWCCRVDGEDLVVLGDVGVHGSHGNRVLGGVSECTSVPMRFGLAYVHESTLEGHARRSRSADVAIA